MRLFESGGAFDFLLVESGAMPLFRPRACLFLRIRSKVFVYFFFGSQVSVLDGRFRSARRLMTGESPFVPCYPSLGSVCLSVTVFVIHRKYVAGHKASDIVRPLILFDGGSRSSALERSLRFVNHAIVR